MGLRQAPAIGLDLAIEAPANGWAREKHMAPTG